MGTYQEVIIGMIIFLQAGGDALCRYGRPSAIFIFIDKKYFDGLVFKELSHMRLEHIQWPIPH